jgi:hypothetical protein
MPRYFKPWAQGAAALRTQLKTVGKVGYFVGGDKQKLEAMMHAAGYPSDQANAIPLTGRGYPLLAVFDPRDLRLLAVFKVR